MKKVMAAAVVLAVLFLFGCAQTPSGPGPAGDPFVPEAGDLVDGFEDGNKISEYGSIWTAVDDGARGGSSVVHSFDVVEGDAYEGTHALRLSATATAELSAEGYHQLYAAEYGYVIIKCNLGSSGADLSNTLNANMISFRVKETSGTGNLSLRGYIFNRSGQYVYTSTYSISGSYNYASINYETPSVPSGSSYSVSDVLQDARRIEVEVKYSGFPGVVESFEVLFDSFKFGVVL